MGEANLINAVVSRRPILSVHNLPGLCELNQTGMPAGLGMRVQSAIATALAGVFYRRARTIVAVSEHVQSELLRKFRLSPKQVAVIPNAVNVEEIQRRASEQADCPWISNGLVVVTAGRLTAAKGQWHLIRAVGEARKQVPVKLVILGSGELEEYLRMLVRHLGLEKDVHFLGWQPNPHKFMARADIFVLPSLSEGFGLVLLEAMACGLPVVTANCPGPPAEIVAPGVEPKSIQRPVFGDYGVVVPALDGRMLDAAASVTVAETMLSDVLVQMARQPTLRQKYRAAAARRVADYGYQEFIFKYQMLIDNISRTT
jgi:glycosyltransferase involved in cell wall biosynthesis